MQSTNKWSKHTSISNLVESCKHSLAVAALASGSMVISAEAQDFVKIEIVRPSQADSAVRQYDKPNVVLVPEGSSDKTPLALFLPGTGGKPENAELLMKVVASQGYRVIGLSYNDEPSLSNVCPQRPNPECSARFREMRIFGRGPAPVENSPEETIQARLIAFLRFLDRQHPGEGWGSYLTPSGTPQWNRILVSGLSQGAGMAAYIAKRFPVYRVVLFSSPWDTTGRDHYPAPWLFEPSVTPPERWWAERHVRENTTRWIANAYRAWRIPSSHVLLFDQGLQSVTYPQGGNPYHPSTIENPAYEPQWKTMFGAPREH